MITSGFGYVVILLLFTSAVVFAERASEHKFFKYVPSIVLIYLGVMLSTTLDIWQWNDSTTEAYKGFKTNLLPAMIFLMLLCADVSKLKTLGVKLIATFFLASVSIALAMVVTYALMQHLLDSHAWQTFAALTGSWMGGTSNMMAVQAALDIPNESLGYALIMDSVDYGIWVMLLLAVVPYASKFNKWTQANTRALEEFLVTSKGVPETAPCGNTMHHRFLLLALSLLVSLTSQHFAPMFPEFGLLSSSAWTIIIATFAGLIAAQTPLNKMNGSNDLSGMMLYFMVALIASRADFSSLTQAPLYVFAGFVILFIHAALMLICAKLFKLDLFSCGIASLANIGGIASAPILASTYSKALVPVGVLMAILGYIVGTFGGLTVAQILSAM